jgi:hypothetical protein
MTEYLTLIQRAVNGLAKNDTDERRALYERARAALLAQLRSVEPALSGAEITKERLALEEAIHKVEAEATRKALGGPRPEQRVASPIPRPFTPERSPGGPATALRRQRPIPTDDSPPPERAQEPQRQEPQRQEPQRQEPQRQEPQRKEPAAQAATAPVKQTARSRILSARTTALRPDGLKGLLRILNEADDRGAATKQASSASSAPEARRRPPKVEQPTAAESIDDRPFDEHDELEPDHEAEDHRLPQAPNARPRTPRAAELDVADEEPHDQPWRPHSYGNWARLAVLLIVAGAVGVAAWQYRDSFAKVYHYVAQLRSQPSNQAAQTTSPPPTKFSGRVPQEGAPGAAASVAGAPPSTQPPPQGAQHAVLLEQDPADPQGKHFDGTVTWRTETVSPGPGLAPELEVHGDIVIPERHVTVTLSLRRNTDKALPASHTIQIMFNLPPDFPGDGVSSMPGIFAKASEQSTGTPLAGISVKVTDNYFLLGLSADPTLQQRNVQLLKDQKWFDIAIVYKNNTKAILAVERGPPGDRAFADAFSAWGE